MYAVCDIALGLMMTKVSNVVLKDTHMEPVLPIKLFTKPDHVSIQTIFINISHIYIYIYIKMNRSANEFEYNVLGFYFTYLCSTCFGLFSPFQETNDN